MSSLLLNMIEYERTVTVKSKIVFFTYLPDLPNENAICKFGRNTEEIETSRRERRMLRTCLRIRTERERGWKKKAWKRNQWDTVWNSIYCILRYTELSIIKKSQVSLIQGVLISQSCPTLLQPHGI